MAEFSLARRTAYLMLPLLLAGCSAMAKPPSALLASNAIGRTAAEQDMVLAQLESSAGISDNGNDHWYQVAKAGFNVVDQQCDIYLDSLYQVQKQAVANATMLHSGQNAAQIILKAYGVAQLTLDVMAQIFGLASVFNDAASKSYLLSIGPANVTGVVYNLQVAYRDEVDRNQRDGGPTVSVASRADAVHQLQSYIRLCSPVYIEAHIGKFIAGSTATPQGAGGERLLLESARGGERRSANISLQLEQTR